MIHDRPGCQGAPSSTLNSIFGAILSRRYLRTAVFVLPKIQYPAIGKVPVVCSKNSIKNRIRRAILRPYVLSNSYEKQSKRTKLQHSSYVAFASRRRGSPNPKLVARAQDQTREAGSSTPPPKVRFKGVLQISQLSGSPFWTIIIKP